MKNLGTAQSRGFSFVENVFVSSKVRCLLVEVLKYRSVFLDIGRTVRYIG
jgi:hypothetical protein